MSERDPKRLSDGVMSYEGGMDGGRSPSLLNRNQSAFLVNATARGGFLKERPAYVKRALLFDDQDEQDAFEDGRFQHGAVYLSDSQHGYLMAVVHGRIYRIDPENNFVVTDLSPATPNANNLLQGWSCQGENYWLYNDGQSPTFIFDGATGRRAAGNELKPGTAISYIMGRLWYALPNGLAFRATDLVGSSSGTPALNYRDAILKETENDFLNEGGDFSVPSNGGPIRAIIPINSLDTSMGQGPVQIFTENCVFSVNAPTDRTTWKNLAYPIQTISFQRYGALAQQSTLQLNSDIFYRSRDGIRSYRIARQTFMQLDWGQTPQSNEVRTILSFDSQFLLVAGSSVNFDNRLLMSCFPTYSDRGIYHTGLTVLDNDLLSSITTKLPPAYDGLWTGLKIFQIVTGRFGNVDRAFMFVLGKTDKIELWEVDPVVRFDNGTVPIAWSVDSRSFDFANPFALKELNSATIYVDQVEGTVNFNVKYKPGQYPCWEMWQSWSECADRCLGNECLDGGLEQLQYRSKMQLTQPTNTENPSSKGYLRKDYEFQVQINVTGAARLKQLRVDAYDQQQAPVDPILSDESECASVTCCSGDPLTYQSDPS